MISAEKFRRCKAEVAEMMERRERLAPKNKVKSEQHLEIYRRSSQEIGMETYLHGLMNFAKTLKLRFRVGDLDLPETIKRYAGSREEEVDAPMRPCG